MEIQMIGWFCIESVSIKYRKQSSKFLAFSQYLCYTKSRD